MFFEKGLGCKDVVLLSLSCFLPSEDIPWNYVLNAFRCCVEQGHRRTLVSDSYISMRSAIYKSKGILLYVCISYIANNVPCTMLYNGKILKFPVQFTQHNSNLVCTVRMCQKTKRHP